MSDRDEPPFDPDADRTGDSHRSPQTRSEKEIASFFILTFGALLTIGFIDDFEPARLGILFFFGAWIVLLVLHEFGHALMARAVGWQVDLISIGFGNIRKRLTVLGMPVEIRSVPIAGFVRPRPRDLKSPRLKDFLIYSAGPGIEILFVALLYVITGSDLFLARDHGSLPFLAAQCSMLAALTGVFFTLLPLPYSNPDGSTSWSDGLGMILCWRLSDDYFRELIEGEKK